MEGGQSPGKTPAARGPLRDDMIDGPWRKVFPRWTGPLLGIYRRFGLTPNYVTILGCLTACVAAGAVALKVNILAVFIWWLSRIFDGTDGIYARAQGQATPFGSYLDITLDMASYSVMLLGFYAAYPDKALYWLVIAVCYVLCITSALAFGELERARGLDAGDNRGLRLASGLAEGGETGIAYTLFLLWPENLAAMLPLWVAILASTVVLRSVLARRVLGDKHKKPILKN